MSSQSARYVQNLEICGQLYFIVLTVFSPGTGCTHQARNEREVSHLCDSRLPMIISTLASLQGRTVRALFLSCFGPVSLILMLLTSHR